jgi:ATP-dependent RNA helicase DeaD
MTPFTELGIHDDILRGLADLGFVEPTPIQERIIPTLLTGRSDVVGLAQSGTGKTAAFGIPLLQLVDARSRQTQALVLCPTRELCVQVAKDVTDFAKYRPGLKVLPVYGGAGIDAQIGALKKGVQIVVATPGRLNDLMRRRKVDVSSIHTVVLDEADEMLTMGFQEELNAILAETPADKRTFLFSATMSREVSAIAGRYMTDPVEVTVGRRNAGADNVSHEYYMVHARDRYPALKRIVDVNPDIYSIIFCRTRQETQDVADKLIQDGYNADALHGDLSQAQRDQVMNKFRRRNTQLLVATDVAARGLDVDDLTHVINYNLPDDTVNYTHRSGRTGRAGKIGISVALIHMRENHRIKELERKLNKKFRKSLIPTGREACKNQLFKLIETMKEVEVNHKQIDPFLPEVMESLTGLDREELVKRFVSIEFNRFLDYYRNAPDLNAPEPRKGRDERNPRNKRPGRDTYRDKKNDRDSRESMDAYFNKKSRKESVHSSTESYAAPPSVSGEEFTRFKINVGKKDGATPSRLIAEINEVICDRRVRFGKIDIMSASTLLEVTRRFAPKVKAAFQDMLVRDAPVIIEQADDQARTNASERHIGRTTRSAKRRPANDGFGPFKRRKPPQAGRSGKGNARTGKSGAQSGNTIKGRWKK